MHLAADGDVSDATLEIARHLAKAGVQRPVHRPHILLVPALHRAAAALPGQRVLEPHFTGNTTLGVLEA